MVDGAFGERQQAILDFIRESLQTQIDVLDRTLRQTRRELDALVALVNRKGIEIDPEEWQAVARELETVEQVEEALDPRFQRGEDVFKQRLRDAGEEGGRD